MHKELRARVKCELVLFREHYFQDKILSFLDPDRGIILKNILPATCSVKGNIKTKDVDWNLAGVELDAETLLTPKLGSYSCMWHLFALASVFKQPIMSIYLHKNKRIRPAFNRTVEPRMPSCDNNMQYIIFWTRLNDLPIWSPNHFVS